MNRYEPSPASVAVLRNVGDLHLFSSEIELKSLQKPNPRTAEMYGPIRS
jgi:hypothetical protein